ncbi:RNA polymerase sigma factor, FliA/WhiG family protein, partial [Chlamydia psittaci C1/97]
MKTQNTQNISEIWEL